MSPFILRFFLGAVVLTALPATGLEIKLDGVKDTILVDLPENHAPGRTWPAVFSYHGQNGEPDTQLTRAHVGPKDWIVVGMAYAKRGDYQLSPQAVKAEIQILNTVKKRLQAGQGLDPKRLYVVGYSKGGWMVDSLLQADRTLAGGAMLMAGHLADLPKNPARFTRPTPVFIGVGREDTNHFYSLKALLFYRGVGAKVDFETWPGIGHSAPANGSVGLREWFVLRNGGRADDAMIADEFKRLSSLPAVEAWPQLTALKDRPFCTVSGSPWPEKITAKLKELEASPEIAETAALERAHRSLLARELKARTAKDFLSLDAGYMKLLQRADGTDLEALATRDHQRVLKVVEQIRKQTPPPAQPNKPIRPNMPERERGIPLNPLVR